MRHSINMSLPLITFLLALFCHKATFFGKLPSFIRKILRLAGIVGPEHLPLIACRGIRGTIRTFRLLTLWLRGCSLCFLGGESEIVSLIRRGSLSLSVLSG